MWRFYNPNPCGKSIGDCAVRAISAAFKISWMESFEILVEKSREMCDLPSADSVWGSVLKSAGFKRKSISGQCPDCYTVEDFCEEHPKGIFVLAFGGHVATVRDGILMDSWNSSQESPIYYYYL